MNNNINIVIAGSISIVSPPKLLHSELIDEFALPNPEYITRKIAGLYLDDTPKEISFAQYIDGQIIIPRGGFEKAKTILKENNISWRIIDRRSSGSRLDTSKQNPYKPRDYQYEASNAIKKYLQGTVLLPCGTGKTYVAMLAIKKIGLTTLVIVPTKDLMYQWTEDAQKILGVQCALIGDGKHERGPLTIAILDSLNNEKNYDFLSSFGFVVHDECHRSCARRNQEVMSKIPAKYRLGLTATKMREDGLVKLIDWTFGPTLVEYNLSDMVAKGYLLAPKIKSITTNFDYTYQGIQTKKIAKTHEAIVSDENRNSIIINLVQKCVNNSPCASILILANRIDFCNVLENYLKQRGLSAQAVTSKTSKKKRNQAISDLKNGSLQIMISTSLADEGLDVPRLSHIVLAFPEKAKGRTIQRIGRIMRPYDNKFPVLYDIVDSKIDMLKKRWYKRKSVYKQLGLIS